MSDTNPSASTDAFGETDAAVTHFDPNYQGDPTTKLESPEDQNVLERDVERDPSGTHDADVSTDPGGGPTSGAGLTEEVRRIQNERAAGTGGHEGPAG